MLNNPLRYADPLGDSAIKPWPGRVSVSDVNPFSPTNWYGVAAVKNDGVRVAYNNEVSTLKENTPQNKRARVDLKEKYRAQTPEPFKTIVETNRPMAGEQAKVNDPKVNNVSKTNVEANEAVKTTGTLGKILIAGGVVNSTINIATSPEPSKQAVVQAGSWAGAIEGGTVGAQIGSAFGIPGAIIGGVGGSILGGVAGSKLGQAIANNVQVGGQRYDRNNVYTWPIMNR